MHPIDHYATLRRGHEELLRRAEYERMARKATSGKRTNWKFHRKVANWLGIHLVRWGEKLEKFRTFAKRQPAPTTTTRVRVCPPFKTSPHH